MNAAALFLVTHGSSDRRSWLALQNLVTIARSPSKLLNRNLLISGGCLEGQPLSLAQQLEQFATESIKHGISEIAVLPVLLLAGVHVSEDIPAEVAIAQSNLSKKLPNKLILHITPHLGTNSQIPNLIWQHFEKYTDPHSRERQGRILVSHGSRRADANVVIEDLAQHSNAIAAYWGVEPKIETQIENLLAQGISQINILPYFLTEGGITEIITQKLESYSDRAQIHLLPVPLSNEQIVDLALKFI